MSVIHKTNFAMPGGNSLEMIATMPVLPTAEPWGSSGGKGRETDRGRRVREVNERLAELGRCYLEAQQEDNLGDEPEVFYDAEEEDPASDDYQ